MGGRPRKPIEVKQAQGTANQTRSRRESEIRIPESIDLDQIDTSRLPAPPDNLIGVGRDLWMRAAVQLKSVGLFFPTVYEYLESYCMAYEIKEEMWKIIKRDGMFVIEGETETKAGVKRKSQEYLIYQEQIEKMIALGAKLVLSPADKAKVSSIIADPTADKNKQKRIGVGG